MYNQLMAQSLSDMAQESLGLEAPYRVGSRINTNIQDTVDSFRGSGGRRRQISSQNRGMTAGGQGQAMGGGDGIYVPSYGTGETQARYPGGHAEGPGAAYNAAMWLETLGGGRPGGAPQEQAAWYFPWAR